MSLIDLIYGTLLEPVETFRQIGSEAKKPIRGAVLLVSFLFLFGLTIQIGGWNGAALKELGGAFSLSPGGGFYAFYTLIGLPLALVMWGIYTAICALLGNLLTGRSNPAGLLCGLAFAQLPMVFAPMMKFIGYGFGLNAVALFGQVAVVIWVCVLQIIAIRESLGIETAPAISVWIIPPVVLIGGLVLLIVAAAGMIATAL
ncbi:MAG: YIP1 family protein [Solirubrobacterales bacterium]